MSEITVTAMEPGRYGVQVTEGDTTTSHRVAIPDDLVDDLGLDGVDGEVLVRETFGFLLDREPATSIMGDFSLDQVPQYFPDYYDEL
jgi:hypothetical protein